MTNLSRPVVLILLAAAYAVVPLYANGFVSLPAPADWWLPGAGQGLRHVAWLHLGTALGLVIGSFPFALAILAVKPRRPVVVATVIAFVALVLPVFLLAARTGEFDFVLASGSSWADLLKFAVVLPALTYCAVQLQSSHALRSDA